MTFRSTHVILNFFLYGEYLRRYNEIVSDSTVRYVHCDEICNNMLLSSVNHKYAKQQIMHLENLCILRLESPLQVCVLHNDVVVNS